MMTYPMSTEEELTAWIRKNRMLFLFNRAHYTPDYVSWLARMNGFDSMMIYRRFSNFDCAMALIDPDHEAEKKTKWTIAEITAITNPITLQDSWKDLGKHLMTGAEFE